MAKNRYKSKFKILVTCGKCNKEFESDVDSLSSMSQDCDLCGSRGDISFYDKCPNCGYWIDQELKGW